MKPTLALLSVVALAILVAAFAPAVQAQDMSPRTYVPASSIERPEDMGIRAHTNIIVRIHPDITNPCGPTCETPASLACIYGIVKVTPGCPIASTLTNPSGGVGAIAIVDAFDNPDAVKDINTYASQWGLPTPTFSVVFADGHRPRNDPGGWSVEEALDIEMAVAAAPKAKIFLVEAHDNSFAGLYLAEKVASHLVAINGGGVVSNSWSGGEYSGQQNDEKKFFTAPGVIYFASTGDSGINNVGVPSTFASVVAVGGTTINRNASGKFTSESWWTGGGGGSSAQEARPTYQNGIQTIVGTHRGVPDFSSDADPNSGPAIYDADGGLGWFQVGGTSVSAPYMAATVNAAGALRKSSNLELAAVYTELGNATQYKADWRDIKAGGAECKTGWDFCTGIGSPKTYAGK